MTVVVRMADPTAAWRCTRIGQRMLIHRTGRCAGLCDAGCHGQAPPKAGPAHAVQ